jgi:hypothetical protein
VTWGQGLGVFEETSWSQHIPLLRVHRCCEYDSCHTPPRQWCTYCVRTFVHTLSLGDFAPNAGRASQRDAKLLLRDRRSLQRQQLCRAGRAMPAGWVLGQISSAPGWRTDRHSHVGMNTSRSWYEYTCLKGSLPAGK